MSIHELDEKTLETIRQLAAAHGCTVEELASAVLQSTKPSLTAANPVLGLMADEPELMDRVVASAYEARETSLRQPKP